MTQVFSPSADTWLRLLAGLGAVAVAGVLLVAGGIVRSDYVTGVGVVPRQPVPFSHEHHVGGLGIDCRYCHTSVEVAANAGFPPTHTCMSCHSQIWTGAPMLAPVRESLATDTALRWERVARVPDFVYFDHHVHIAKGVGCVTCHGRVDKMPLLARAEPFQMQWCLDCHRDPAPNLRPSEEVFDMAWSPQGDREALAERLMSENHVQTAHLTDCYTCHR
ncbi:MAG: cytochrome c3 family protein [Rhodospirillales bacterium]|nr:cytochrome c3 family protein [Rhodospirillales bacterium]